MSRVTTVKISRMRGSGTADSLIPFVRIGANKGCTQRSERTFIGGTVTLLTEALHDVVFLLNAMVEQRLIPTRLCGECFRAMSAVPIMIDLNGGPPWTPSRPFYPGNVPRWFCESCQRTDPVSTDHFLLALDYRADAISFLSNGRKPVNKRTLEISLMLKRGSDACYFL